MKEKLKTVFYCEFCKKHSLAAHSMEKHEQFYPKKPDNIPKCADCVFLKQEKIEYYYDTFMGERSGTSNVFRCTKLDKLMYPLKAVKIGLLDKYPEQFDEQSLMPNKCDSFQSKYVHP